jgi:hypothetical protein
MLLKFIDWSTPSPLGILGVKSFVSMIYRQLVSAKYSKQKGCVQNIARTGVMGAAMDLGLVWALF